ncbi:MAG: hydrolase [Bacillales bacterium]|jgi:pimeloyl-ACP methyl ester carboxylesterase|nr:hydrolase [Bacillales bacterium]
MKSFYSFDGTVIHYTEKGLGTPIIFIHPPLLTSDTFYYQVKELQKQFRVITFDIRGHGNSGTSNEIITYPLIVKDIIALMDFLKIEKTYLCGYSTGGSIAIEGMCQESHRFYGSVLIGAQSDASDWFLRSEIKMAISLCRKSCYKLLSYAIAKGNSNNKLTFRRLYNSAQLGDANSWKQYYEASLQFNRTGDLSSINSPCLLIFGEKNTSFYRYAKKLQDGLPNYQMHWVKDAKHQIPTKNAAEMNATITHWLTKLAFCD